MQVTYRLTDKEFLHSRRINKLLWIPRWKSLCLALVCLLPSIGLVALASSFIMLIAFTFVAAFLIVMIAWALAKQPKLVDKYDHVVTFSPVTLHESSSHSEFELRWHHFDEFIENDEEFLFRRLERFTYLPKRVFSPEQCDQLRSFATSVSGESSESDPPIETYSKVFGQPEQNRIHEFTYQPEDLIQAATDPLTIIDTTQIEKPKKRTSRLVSSIIWLAAIVFISNLLFRSPTDPSSKWTLTEYLTLFGVIILPFVLLLVLNRLVRRRYAKRQPQVPREKNKLVLLKDGFAIGTPNSVAFYDWRDIDAFYRNGSCFGFKSFNDLIQVIPKRIFADDEESESFLNQAIDFHREYRRTFEVPATAVETGNPYQPPAC